MTLEQILETIDQLSQDERRQLRQYLDRIDMPNQQSLKPGTMDVDQLLDVVDDIRRDLSDSDLDEIIAAMNEEYIEPIDDSLWNH